MLPSYHPSPLVGRKLNASREQAELLITCYFTTPLLTTLLL